MKAKTIASYYKFLCIMIASMILGSVTGCLAPGFASVIAPLGKVFINMMFCVVVPLVFASISSAIAAMESRKKAGKILAVTVITFVVTGIIAAIIIFVILKFYPPVLTPWSQVPSEEIGEYASVSEMIVNFFTASDFSGLLSRKAMLPLIVFSILFGFAVNKNGGIETPVGKFIQDLSQVMLKFVRLIGYYSPVAFFAIFANLVADYGPQITADYGRALLVYYPLCFIYLITAFPLFASFGGGKGAVGIMFRHIIKPAVVSLGTCSSVATIPTNMDEAEATGISKDVAKMVIPLGATMHKDGSCFASILKVVFVFGVLGQEISWSQMPFIIFISVFAAVGTSGVPGGGYIGEYILCSLFFPNHSDIAFPVMIAIGNLVDPPATMINAAGDYVVSFIVSRFIDGRDWLHKK